MGMDKLRCYGCGNEIPVELVGVVGNISGVLKRRIKRYHKVGCVVIGKGVGEDKVGLRKRPAILRKKYRRVGGVVTEVWDKVSRGVDKGDVDNGDVGREKFAKGKVNKGGEIRDLINLVKSCSGIRDEEVSELVLDWLRFRKLYEYDR